MGLEKFNPFKRDSPNLPNVVIPLADGPAHHLSEKTDKKTSSDGESSSVNGAAGPNDSTCLTLEGLRAEIEADVSTSTNDSAYDRMFLQDFFHWSLRGSFMQLDSLI